MKNEIQRIISGYIAVRYGTTIKAAANYLKQGTATSALAKTNKHLKRKETEILKQYILIPYIQD